MGTTVDSEHQTTRHYSINRIDVSHGDGYIWLNCGPDIVKTYVRDFFRAGLKEGDRVKGSLSLHVYGNSVDGYTSLNKATDSLLYIKPNNDSVEFRAKILSLLDSHASIVKTGTGSAPRISFTAVVDIDHGRRAFLMALDLELDRILVGDILEGDALPMFNPAPE